MLYTIINPHLILFVYNKIQKIVALLCIRVLWDLFVCEQYITGQTTIAKDMGSYITLSRSPCLYHAYVNALHDYESSSDTVCMRRAPNNSCTYVYSGFVGLDCLRTHYRPENNSKQNWYIYIIVALSLCLTRRCACSTRLWFLIWYCLYATCSPLLSHYCIFRFCGA